MGKDDLAKRLTELESRLKQRDDELSDLQKRFDEHMSSNASTERSLNDRIDDLFRQLKQSGELREQDGQIIDNL